MPRLFVRPFALFAAAALLAPVAQAARQDGLVTYLTFDDTANPLKNFAPGSGLAEPTKIGEALEPTYTEGRFGKAALFSSQGSAKAISDWAISLGKMDTVYGGSFTVSCWVKIPQANNGVIIGNKESFNVASGWGISARFGKHFQVSPLGGSSQEAYKPGFEKAWRNVVFVVDRVAGSANVYVDGQKNNAFKLPSSDAKLGDDQATVIGAGANGAYGVKCAVDEVGIWNRALTEKEIAAIGSGRRIPEASSVLWTGAGLSLAGLAALKRRRRAKVA